MTPCMNLEDNQKGVAEAVRQASARLSGGERRWRMTPLAKGLLVASAGLPPVDHVGKTCNDPGCHPEVVQGCHSELSPGLCWRLSRLQSDTDQLIAVVAGMERLIEVLGGSGPLGLLGRHLSFGRGTTGMTPPICIGRVSW
jgi:hypothetical protein